MMKEVLTIEDTFADDIDDGIIIPDKSEVVSDTEDSKEADDFVIDFSKLSENDPDPYGYGETYERFRNDLGLGEGSRALQIANEMAEKERIEEARKKEKERLYKTDKKCYNIIEDDKKCHNKDDEKIYTRINIRKIKRLLKYNELTYDDVAVKLNTTRRTVTRKLNVQADLTANEFVLIAELLDIDINELVYKNIH